MALIEQLFPASFRKIPFLVAAETESAGKKTVTHEYVNNNKRFTEELGLLPPIFTLDAVIHGEDSVSQRLALKNALDQPGLGTLVHPIYGSIEVKSTTYSINSNQTNVGEFRFTINFETSEAVVTAEIETITESSISVAAQESRDAADNKLEDAFIAPRLAEELTESGNKLDEVLETVDKFAQGKKGGEVDIINELGLVETIVSEINSGISYVRSKLADFTRVTAEARSKVFAVVQVPADLKSQLQTFYSASLEIVNTPVDLANAWSLLTDFGFLDIKRDTITLSRLISEGNKSSLNQHTRITALINLHESYGSKEYTTDTEIQASRDDLNEKFNRIVENYSGDIADGLPVLVEDKDLRDSLFNLRTLTSKLLDEKEQNVWRVVTISPGISSMALTTYRYYGNLDNLELLEGLNPDISHARFNEQIQAVA
jgi:prophage DNA circulation protein